MESYGFKTVENIYTIELIEFECSNNLGYLKSRMDTIVSRDL